MSSPDPSAAAASAELTGLDRKWFRFCALGTAGFLSLHAIYSLPAVPLPRIVTELVGFVLFMELYVFFALVVVALFLLPLLIGGVLVALMVPRFRGRIGGWSDRPSGGREWVFRPRLHSVAWTLLFVGHLSLDINPYLTWACGGAVLLLLPGFWKLVSKISRRLGERKRAVSLLTFGSLWLFADDRAVAVAALSFGVVLLLATRFPGRFLCSRDRLVLVLLTVPVVQMVAVLLPAAIQLHDGRKLGDGMAYSFCEDEASHRLFAVVPHCTPNETELCRANSTIDELDARTLKLRAHHRFFSKSYAGRLEQLVCLPGLVQVGMDYTVFEGQPLVQNLLEFPPDRPEDFRPNALGDASGDGIAHDRRRNAVFYRSDEDLIIRRDLGSGEIRRDIVRNTKGIAPVADILFDNQRDTLFVLRHYGSVEELSATTFETLASYPILSAWEFTLDQELRRLYVVGSWGLEVVDLRSRRVIQRARVAFGGRRPAIDGDNDLVYVPSTAGGRLHVFERRRFQRVGTIPLGIGVRYPYVSKEHRYLLATGDAAYYAWDTDELAARLRGRKTVNRGARERVK